MAEALENDPVFSEVQLRNAGTQSPLVPTENVGATAITSISSGSSGIGASVVGGVATLVSPLTTKGDIFARNGSAGTRLPVGNEGESIFADPAESTGLKYRPTEFVISEVLDLNTNTKQSLYTVPPGKSAIITTEVFHSPSVDLSGGGTTRLTSGFDAGATDFGPQFFNPTILTATDHYAVFDQQDAAPAAPSVIGAAGDEFGVITDSAFGSAATVVVDLYVRLF